MNKIVVSLALLIAALAPAQAEETQPDPAVIGKIEQVMTKIMPNFTVESVVPSVIDGLYDVSIKDGPQLLSTADGNYFIRGDIYTSANGKLENLSELARKGEYLQKVETFDKDDLIVFPAQSRSTRWIAVFTDIQCGYCRKFHNDVPELNKMGIEVRYFAYPIFDGSRDKMISALCAKDRQQALTTLKAGGSIPAKSCSGHDIDAQFNLARSFRISGTPAIMLDDGTLLKGYVEPKQLAQQMGL